jgi:signal transduction histidine kinase
MSFRRFAGFLLLANSILIIVMTASFLWFTNKLSRNSDVMFAATEEIATAHKIESGILAYSRESLMFEATRDESRLIARAHARDQVVRMLERAKHQRIGLNDPRVIDDLAADIHNYFSRREVLERLGTDQSEILRELSPKVDEIVAHVDSLVAQGQKIASTGVSSALEENIASDSVALTAALIILACLVASFFGVWMLVFRPLYEINKSVEFFREGLIREPPSGGLTEINLLSETVSRMMKENVQNRQLLLQNIAAVAHDIRNPLTAILSAADMAADPGDPNHQDFVDIIGRQSRYLDQIVRDLMDSTRLEAGNMAFRLGPCDLCEIVQESVRLFEHHSPGHCIRFAPVTAPVRCIADRVRISQVVNNLISNAIKYAPDGGAIDLTVSVSQATAEFTVTDHGIGIAPEDLGGIFVPFHRARASAEKFPGVGLGLATAKKIAEAHAGQLTVSSVVGKGSSFCLSLPLANVGQTVDAALLPAAREQAASHTVLAN